MTPEKQKGNPNVWNRLANSSSPDKKKRSPYTWRYTTNEGDDLRAGKTSDFFKNAHDQGIKYR